jgi:hypothetical protein
VSLIPDLASIRTRPPRLQERGSAGLARRWCGLDALWGT